MPDLDQLLARAGTVGRAAADAAHAPDFGDVVRRGRRRRAVRNGAGVGGAVLAVAVVVGGAQVVAGRDAGRPEPVGPAGPSPTSTGLDVRGVPTVAPLDAASVGDAWSVVWDQGEGEDDLVVSFRDDPASPEPVRTRAWLPEGTRMTAVADGSFVVAEGGTARLQVTSPVDGQGRAVTTDGAASPVAEGEVPVVLGTGVADLGVVAVDPVAGTAHAVAGVPDGLWEIEIAGGRIAALGSADREGLTRVHWSDDGGATWASADLPSGTLHDLVPTVPGEDVVVVETVDGASPAPFEAEHRVAADGTVTSVRPEGPAASFEATFTCDGVLHLVGATYTPDGVPAEAGIYRLADDATLERVPSGAPELTDRVEQPVTVETGPSGEPVLWLSAGGGSVVRSDDCGASFEQLPGR